MLYKILTMLYEIRYEINGQEGSKKVRADSDAEALEKFRQTWELYGDKPPADPWIAGRWSER